MVRVLRTGVAFSITVKAAYPNLAGMLGTITSTVGNAGGDVNSVDLVRTDDKGEITREFTINTANEEHGKRIVDAIATIDNVRILGTSDATFDWHAGGKIATAAKRAIVNRDDMTKAYTPGVGRVALAIHENPEKVWSLTSKSSSVAIVSDGSAVLGLGNLGPMGALPVMEGKALIFKQFANIDAWPLVLSVQDPDKVVEAVKAIAPGFGGINLEDIAAPNCFYVEDRLREELDIPVFHDDQHGTAVVVLAGLINASKVVGKRLADCKVVVLGPGAAGTACVKLLLKYGIGDVVVFDRQGALSKNRAYASEKPHLRWLAENTNRSNWSGNLADGLAGADIFLGVAGPDAVQPDWVKTMSKDAIVFALSNPTPEMMPGDAPDNVRVMATGRSDFPNQVNNAVCFPGFFRGLLDAHAKQINYEMKIRSAVALASVVDDAHLSEDLVLPSMFDKNVVGVIATAVKQCAVETGAARASHDANA